MFEKIFHLKEKNTTVRMEIIGGMTTFFAMAYIIFVNPMYLSQTGMEFNAVLVATCLSTAVGCFLTAFLANVPFAQAPAMGLNAFFTYTLCLSMGYSWQQGLALVFISGLIFLGLMVTPIRGKIIASIPVPLKAAISAGIGLFITFIGLLNANIITLSGTVFDSFGTITSAGYSDMGNITSGAPLLALIGLAITAVLMAWKVRGAIFLGILITTVVGIPMGQTVFPESMTLSGVSIAPTFLKMDFAGVFGAGALPFVTALITLVMCDCFDTVGTLIGTARNAGMLTREGTLPGGDRALIADALATCVGACLGTSTVSTYVESSTGIAEGARTGLSSIVVGIMFLISILLAPVAAIIPSAAITPALIVVGMLMIGNLSSVNWKDVEEAVPCFLSVIIMPFSYSICDGIGFGIISYTVIKVLRGKMKEVPVLMYILSALFIAMYVLTFR